MQTGRGRPRTRCERCAPKRDRRPVAVTAAPVMAVQSGLLESVRSELAAAGVAGTVLGQTALLLAERLEAGTDNGSSVAALVRQLRETMAAAMANEVAVADPLDELAVKRELRRSSI